MSKKSRKRANPRIPKSIVLIANVLQSISSQWTARFAARLFTTPVKHKMPRREFSMERDSRQEDVFIPQINKRIRVYFYGKGQPVLLVHGWSGRGTQLVKFAEPLIAAGYSTVSFDAPAHGKSGGKTTIMPEFIASVLELEKQFGPFVSAIGHSLGGMTLLNSARLGLNLKSLVVIGSGDVIRDIIAEFVHLLRVKPQIAELMRLYFEKSSPEPMDSYSSFKAASELDIPVLVIHDENDREVRVACAHHIHQHLKKGKLMITKGLGHRKILGSPHVITASVDYIKDHS